MVDSIPSNIETATDNSNSFLCALTEDLLDEHGRNPLSAVNSYSFVSDAWISGINSFQADNAGTYLESTGVDGNPGTAWSAGVIVDNLAAFNGDYPISAAGGGTTFEIQTDATQIWLEAKIAFDDDMISTKVSLTSYTGLTAIVLTFDGTNSWNLYINGSLVISHTDAFYAGAPAIRFACPSGSHMVSAFFASGTELSLTDAQDYYASGDGTNPDAAPAIPVYTPSIYTELCVRSGGNNFNSGSLWGGIEEEGLTALFTFSGGAWDGTDTFTPASGDPSALGVAVGMLVAINDSSALVVWGRVSAVDATTITLTAQVGTAVAGTYEMRIGGAWAGPSGADRFIFETVTFDGGRNFLNQDELPPRINIKNDQTYTMTTAITAVYNMVGYETAYGDSGLALFDFGATGGAYNLFIGTSTSQSTRVQNIRVDSSATAGACFYGATSYKSQAVGCKANGNKYGFQHIGCEECEAYNQSTYGFIAFPYAHFCYSYNAAVTGFYGHSSISYCTIAYCIADTAQFGFSLPQGSALMVNSDAYNCSGAGVQKFYNTTPGIIINSNFVSCGNGAETTGPGVILQLKNCGFFGCTNNSAPIATTAIELIDCFDYSANPYNDAVNGDFTLVSEESLGQGRFVIPQSLGGRSGTTGVASVGAASPAVEGAATQTSRKFSRLQLRV